MACSVLSPFCRPIAPEGAFCKPEEDPFLLLESSLRCIERILLFSEGQPLRRTWIEHPYGEEEITLLEEEVLPALQHCLQRVDEIDQRLLAEQEAAGALPAGGRSRGALRAEDAGGLIGNGRPGPMIPAFLPPHGGGLGEARGWAEPCCGRGRDRQPQQVQWRSGRTERCGGLGCRREGSAGRVGKRRLGLPRRGPAVKG